MNNRKSLRLDDSASDGKDLKPDAEVLRQKLVNEFATIAQQFVFKTTDVESVGKAMLTELLPYVGQTTTHVGGRRKILEIGEPSVDGTNVNISMLLGPDLDQEIMVHIGSDEK